MKTRIGNALALSGSAISCAGVVANNLLLDHILAMQIWQFSNIILLAWAWGIAEFKIQNYTKTPWWTCGLSGVMLCGMYAFYTVTNAWGLMHV